MSRWRWCASGERKLLDEFLLARALEHDAPGVLLQLACDWLRAELMVRPPVDALTRRVAAARDAARAETYHRLVPLLTPPRPRQLDGLLDVDPDLGITRLAWLRRGATAATSEVLKAELDKLEFLRRHGADQLGPPRSPADPAGTGIRRWGPVPGLSAPNPRAALSDQAPRVDDSIPASFSAGPNSTRCSFALLRNPDLTSGAWPETREVSNWARF